MNTPNPLVPQGSLQQQQSHGKSKVRIAVFLVIALHSVFFTLLLMQGCGGDDPGKVAGKASGTQTETNEVGTLNTNYYGVGRDLPSVATNFSAPPSAPASNVVVQQSGPPTTVSPTPAPPVSDTPPAATEYTIVRGDYLYKIAAKFGVSVAALTNANPGIEPTRLQPGQKIQIPAPTPSAPASTAGNAGAESATGNGALKVHVVKGGETLTTIAKQHGTTAKAIRAANDMKTDRILVGKKLKIPAPQKPAAGNSASGTPAAPGRMATLPGGTSTPNTR